MKSTKFEELKNKIKGPIFPVIPPFKDDEEVDYDVLFDYIDFLYLGGARVFYAMCYSSRFTLLEDEEIDILNLYVSKYIKKKYNDCIVIVADPLACRTTVSRDFAQNASYYGADAISLIFSERYHFEEQILKHYELIAKSAPNIGILIHADHLNTHSSARIPYPIDLLKKLAQIDNVIALKEDSKDYEYSKEIIKSLKDELAILVSGRAKEQYMNSEPYGAQSYLIGIGSFAPEISTTFYKSYQEGNKEKCKQIVENIEQPYLKIAKKYGWHISLRSSLEYCGLMSRNERMPLMKLPEPQHREIVKATQDVLDMWETLKNDYYR